jgi:hypothetical protein
VSPDELKAIQELHEFYHEAIWTVLGLFVAAIAKETITEIIMGFLWWWRSGYKRENIVKLEGELAQIQHVGFLKTEFHVFKRVYDPEKKKFKLLPGWIRVIQNCELRSTDIQRRRPTVPEEDIQDPNLNFDPHRSSVE